MMQGDFAAAWENRSRTRAAPTPTNISTNSEPEMLKKGTPASPATALARSVLPVPGAPTRRMPRGIRPPRSSKRCGVFRKSTTSCSSSLASSIPATSPNVIRLAPVSATSFALLCPMLSTPGPPDPMRIMKKFHRANMMATGRIQERMFPRNDPWALPVNFTPLSVELLHEVRVVDAQRVEGQRLPPRRGKRALDVGRRDDDFLHLPVSEILLEIAVRYVSGKPVAEEPLQSKDEEKRYKNVQDRELRLFVLIRIHSSISLRGSRDSSEHAPCRAGKRPSPRPRHGRPRGPFLRALPEVPSCAPACSSTPGTHRRSYNAPSVPFGPEERRVPPGLLLSWQSSRSPVSI